jgi:hypothetical protein
MITPHEPAAFPFHCHVCSLAKLAGYFADRLPQPPLVLANPKPSGAPHFIERMFGLNLNPPRTSHFTGHELNPCGASQLITPRQFDLSSPPLKGRSAMLLRPSLDSLS